MKSDAELLLEFAAKRSEAAFTAFVRRHLNFVFSAALRQVGGDTLLAKDATQLVFCDVARKATALAHHPALSGWLHRAAFFAAAKIVRAERRRRWFENEAALMQGVTASETETDWNEVRGILDAALLELNQDDREAILLRFFPNEPFSAIGAKLNVPEDTARKRVTRALDKLHARLSRRGIFSTAAGLATVLSQHSVHGAPAGLVDVVAHKALNPAAVTGPRCSTAGS